MPESAHSPTPPGPADPNLLNSVFNSSIHSHFTVYAAIAASAALCSETALHVSTIREVLICPTCQLKQYERVNGRCRKCQAALGVAFIEIHLSSGLTSLTSQKELAIRKRVGGLIRGLRSRRDITQAALASLTGIHRTYLSRAERGQVMPSIIALMRIARALNVDKVLLRVRSSRN